MTSAWWTVEREKGSNPELALSAARTFKSIDDEQDYRRSNNIYNLQLYTNISVFGLTSTNYMTDGSLPSNRLKLNVIESVIEAGKAIISTNRPKVKFMTEGGNYTLREKAKKMTDFVSGMFYEQDIYAKNQDVFGDAEWSGTGFVKIFDRDKKIFVERVFPNEIVVDDVEGFYGDPKTLYHHKEIERSVLLGQYKKLENEIASAGTMRNEADGWRDSLADPVSVVEAWRLPSDGIKGRRIKFIDTATLEDDEFDNDSFPVIPFHWIRRPLGYYGKGVPEQLRGLQTEINIILQKIQRHMKLASSKVFIQVGSQVNKKQLDNTEWGSIEYAGEKAPVLATIAAISPEYAAQVERLYQKAFEISGISQLAAQSKKPSGLDSGEAIRQYNDIQSQRFLHVGQRWEAFHLSIAKQLVNCARRIAKKHGDYIVTAEINDQLKKISWKDVDPGDNPYRMKAWPVNLLPDEPAGKIQTMMELSNVDPRLQPYMSSLLKNPDIEPIIDRLNAPLLLADKIVENILTGKEFIPPEPFFGLESAISTIQHAYIQAKLDGVEENKLSELRQWIEMAEDILNRAAMQQQQMMAEQQMQAQQAQAMQQLPAANQTPIGEAIPGKI